MLDVIIIGAGPAGLTAGLYCARARLRTLLLERLGPGGQMLNTERIENYPGFPEAISGFELSDRMRKQAEAFGLEIRNQEVLQLELDPVTKHVVTAEGPLDTRALIVTTGASPRRLGVEGEVLLTGKGVSYCATCDGPFFREEIIAVVGGGDTAVEEAVYLTRFAKEVHLIHRRDALRATRILQERALAEEKIHIHWDTVVTRIRGEAGVEALDLKNVKTGKTSSLPVKGVFVLIGYLPNNELVKGQLDCDEQGFVLTNPNMESSVPGVFVAGDLRSKLLRQVVTAVGEGATAAFAAEKHLENLR